MKITAGLMVAAMLLVANGGSAFAASCRGEIGAAKAAALVRQCTEVSPATHPPCNASNPCALIIGEIKRGCGLLASGGSPPAPAFCRKY